METRLVALNAELEMLKEGYAVKYNQFMSKLDEIINKWFVTPYDATCTRRWLRTTHFEGEIEVCFEIGFYNTEENRIDFGSDFWLDYSSKKNELRVNYGTCGYHSKADVYQTKRIKLLAHVWDHIDEIESELSCFSENILPEVSSHLNKTHEIEFEIYRIQNELKKTRREEADKQLCKHAIIFYPEDSTLACSQKLFGGKMLITKRTPKFIIANDEYGRECKFRANDIINHIVGNYMTITQE